MHPSIKFMFENPKIIYKSEKKVRFLNFIDVKIILHENNSVEIDIYYKSTNTRDCLPYDNVHLDHTKNNITHNLAKRIIVFVSNPEKIIIHLAELRQFLKECKYPEYVVSESIFNAKIQGPAPKPGRSKNVIPFVTAYYPNIDNKTLM